MKVVLTEFIQLKVGDFWSSIPSDHSVSVTHHQQEEVQQSSDGHSVAADRAVLHIDRGATC